VGKPPRLGGRDFCPFVERFAGADEAVEQFRGELMDAPWSRRRNGRGETGNAMEMLGGGLHMVKPTINDETWWFNHLLFSAKLMKRGGFTTRK
jgi:hypothetical protein